MYPYYTGYVANMRLHSDDINGIRYLYGRKWEYAIKNFLQPIYITSDKYVSKFDLNVLNTPAVLRDSSFLDILVNLSEINSSKIVSAFSPQLKR